MNHYQKSQLPLLLIKGHTLREIAEMYGVSTVNVSKYIRLQLERNLSVPLYFNSKTVAYYENEMEYGLLPTYTWDELSESEKEFYNKYAV